MFPRHVLEYMVARGSGSQLLSNSEVGGLATSHKDVTIMFMDIVGFTTMSKSVRPAQV
jgi:class 3 adenylate cyclase